LHPAPPLSYSKTYFNNLDALRFFAAFAVISAHLASWLTWPDGLVSKWVRVVITLDGSSGMAGVSFFFTLSGFLITYLMYQENEERSSFHILNFYVRRLLRIWPLYFFSLLIGFLVYPLVSNVEGFKETAHWEMYVLFLTNFDYIYYAPPLCGLLSVQWSIAVEEQFYLIWPWVFTLAGGKQFFHWVCVGIITISVVFHVTGGPEYHTLTALNDLGIGALLAYFAFCHFRVVLYVFERLSKTVTIVLYSIGILLHIGHFQIVSRFPSYGAVDHFVNAVFFGFVILEQNYSPHSFFKFGSVKVFNELGKISYGIYLLHMVAIFLVLAINRQFSVPVVINAGLVLILTVALSYTSYRFLEKP
jgi:peptidoglycan/LPS O-acetylase OafA/YrhL